ncbi:hypothetical protein OG21DRAFT_1046306 [Imleria badia]|nr:hypothetical protein OG21DRAFT_1046306 [Imleria badia]
MPNCSVYGVASTLAIQRLRPICRYCTTDQVARHRTVGHYTNASVGSGIVTTTPDLGRLLDTINAASRRLSSRATEKRKTVTGSDIFRTATSCECHALHTAGRVSIVAPRTSSCQTDRPGPSGLAHKYIHTLIFKIGSSILPRYAGCTWPMGNWGVAVVLDVELVSNQSQCS